MLSQLKSGDLDFIDLVGGFITEHGAHVVADIQSLSSHWTVHHGQVIICCAFSLFDAARFGFCLRHIKGEWCFKLGLSVLFALLLPIAQYTDVDHGNNDDDYECHAKNMIKILLTGTHVQVDWAHNSRLLFNRLQVLLCA